MTSLRNLVFGTMFAAASLAPVAAQDANRLLNGRPLLEASPTAQLSSLAPNLESLLSVARSSLPHLFTGTLAQAVPAQTSAR
ncbi:MAG: hypothetical protein JOY77_11980 [Alphaproteobacteria bacterium]|nr:hypothetical protein [Alphaproteobacteria bacterium]MBV9063629.1 hypothetical protein [Alphaproteobacteria bacterium]